MSPPKLVMLDVGETLVHGPPLGPAGRIAAAAGLDAARRRALHVALMTRPFAAPAEVCAALELPEPLVAEVWEAQTVEPRPIAGAHEAVEALAARGIALALVSNIWRPYYAAFQRHFAGVPIPDDRRVLSFRLGTMKPDRRMFTTALAAAGVEPGEAVMVGDSLDKDVEPAAALGIRAVQVTRDDGGVTIAEVPELLT